MVIFTVCVNIIHMLQWCLVVFMYIILVDNCWWSPNPPKFYYARYPVLFIASCSTIRRLMKSVNVYFNSNCGLFLLRWCPEWVVGAARACACVLRSFASWLRWCVVSAAAQVCVLLVNTSTMPCGLTPQWQLTQHTLPVHKRYTIHATHRYAPLAHRTHYRYTCAIPYGLYSTHRYTARTSGTQHTLPVHMRYTLYATHRYTARTAGTQHTPLVHKRCNLHISCHRYTACSTCTQHVPTATRDVPHSNVA